MSQETVINPQKTKNVVYPEDKSQSGSHYWHVLFNIASQYSLTPTRADKIDMSNLIKSIIAKFPCQKCVSHAFDFINQHPIRLDNREDLMKYLCELKNHSNQDEGKEPIDCNNFVLNSLNNSSGGCHSCSLGSFKAPYVNTKNNEPLPVPVPVKKTLPNLGNVLAYETRYPSFQNLQKRAMFGGETITSGIQQPSSQDLASKYPSLAEIDPNAVSNTIEHEKEEELDGLLTPLDGIYSIPAGMVGIKPQEMNLATTPEIISNMVSMLSQIYMTNLGGMTVSGLGGLGLFIISMFTKNGLGRYDRLLLQNISSSLIMHTLNFLNPRIRDEMMEDGGKLIEGITSLDFDKIKSSLLFAGKEEKDKEKSNKELLKQVIDMDKLPRAYASATDPLNLKSSVNDLRMLGTSSTTTAPMTRGQIESRFRERNQLSSPLDHVTDPYSIRRPHEPYDSMIDSMDDQYGYILDSSIF